MAFRQDIPNPEVFRCIETAGHPSRYICRVCGDGKIFLVGNCARHLLATKHKAAVQYEAEQAAALLNQPQQHPSESRSPWPPAFDNHPFRDFLIAASMIPDQPSNNHDTAHGSVGCASHSSEPIPVAPPSVNWPLQQILGDTHAELADEDDLYARIRQATEDYLNGDISDFEEGPERSDVEVNLSDSESDHGFDQSLPRKRARGGTTDPAILQKWFPWPDRISCSLDIITHLPRSAFSRKQLDLLLWLLKVNHVDDVPSAKSVKVANETLQKLCGIRTIECDGKQGHRYYVNSLHDILSQEMANPQVRPHLRFYPEDNGKAVNEARQAAAWLKEIPSEDTTPMIRLKQVDYYIYEPAMLIDSRCCIPNRWFTRGNTLFANAWLLQPHANGWIVCKGSSIEVSESQLLKNFQQLSKDHVLYGVSHPSRIVGVQDPSNGPDTPLSKWTHTNPIIGNPWREKAKGHRVVSLPLWMYCDDTSGNKSKKWNKHNSFLFTLAGLPREHAAKEYNIHFLCTSNIAAPLEMLEGVVEQIKSGLQSGIWAWDCVFKEQILIIPPCLCFLGDNPMHSEFACHIGLRGKYFCRICWVKGTDAQDVGHNPEPLDHGASDHSIMHDSEQEVLLSDAPSIGSEPLSNPIGRKRRHFQESMSAMIKRVTEFLKPGKPRCKAETLKTLEEYHEQSKTIGTKTKLKKFRTETGIKDSMQEYFLDRLSKSYKGINGPADKQKALDSEVSKLPETIVSPVWQLGLDPHKDTPVEILHVVLLGFVKYFWRDLVQNQVKDDQRQLLITRLNSVDVKGLGISPINGETLVKYAGSLTGRDFRIISQIAPFVIYDLVPQDVFAAWMSLSTMVPLIWQPSIEDIDKYLVDLRAHVDDFLLKTAQWTCAWFNKAKFHIVLHLAEHIRRFGPPILFATEGFESFNAVIRAQSIHSNRLAPSRDIAIGFAQANRVRHLLSGGYFLPSDLMQLWQQDCHSVANSEWRTAGSAAVLLGKDPTPAGYLGLLSMDGVVNGVENTAGHCKPDGTAPRPWTQTLTGERLPSRRWPNDRPLYKTCQYVALQNGDRCSVGQNVIVRDGTGLSTYVGCVREILQEVGSHNQQIGKADGVLVQVQDVETNQHALSMPRLVPVNQWCFLPLAAILCTVNTQHNCPQYDCLPTGRRTIVQERKETQHSKNWIHHASHPEDCLLNTAQMRDAAHIRPFHVRTPSLDTHVVVERSVAQAVQARKLKQAGGMASSVKKAGPRRGNANRGPASASDLMYPGQGLLDFNS